MSRGALEIQLAAEITELRRKLGAAEKRIDKFSRTGSKSLGAFASKGTLAMGAAAGAVGAFVVSAVKDFAEFERKSAEVYTLLPGMSRQAFDALEADLRQFSVAEGVDQIDAFGASYQALSAGIADADLVGFLGEARGLALGGVTDLTTGVDLLTTVLNAYNLESSEAANVNDVLFTTVLNGKTTIGELGASLGQVIPIANSFNVSIDKVGLGMATLTSQGISTAEAGTALRGLFNELGNSTKGLGERFKELTGQAFAEFMAGGGTLADVMEVLSAEAASTGVTLTELFSNIRAGTAAAALASDAGMDMAESWEVSGTAAEDAAAKMKDTLGYELDKLTAQWNEAKLVFAEELLDTGVLQDGIDLLGQMTPAIKFVAQAAGVAITAFETLAEIIADGLLLGAKSFVMTADSILAVIEALIDGINDLGKWFGLEIPTGWLDSARGALEDAEGFIDAMLAVDHQTGAFADGIENAEEKLEEFEGRVRRAPRGLTAAREAAEELAESVADQADEVAAATDAWDAYIRKVSTFRGESMFTARGGAGGGPAPGDLSAFTLGEAYRAGVDMGTTGPKGGSGGTKPPTAADIRGGQADQLARMFEFGAMGMDGYVESLRMLQGQTEDLSAEWAGYERTIIGLGKDRKALEDADALARLEQQVAVGDLMGSITRMNPEFEALAAHTAEFMDIQQQLQTALTDDTITVDQHSAMTEILTRNYEAQNAQVQAATLAFRAMAGASATAATARNRESLGLGSAAATEEALTKQFFAQVSNVAKAEGLSWRDAYEEYRFGAGFNLYRDIISARGRQATDQKYVPVGPENAVELALNPHYEKPDRDLTVTIKSDDKPDRELRAESRPARPRSACS